MTKEECYAEIDRLVIRIRELMIESAEQNNDL